MGLPSASTRGIRLPRLLTSIGVCQQAEAGNRSGKERLGNNLYSLSERPHESSSTMRIFLPTEASPARHPTFETSFLIQEKLTARKGKLKYHSQQTNPDKKKGNRQTANNPYPPHPRSHCRSELCSNQGSYRQT